MAGQREQAPVASGQRDSDFLSGISRERRRNATGSGRWQTSKAFKKVSDFLRSLFGRDNNLTNR